MVIVIEAVQNFFQSIGFFWQSVILLAIGFLVGNMRRHSTKEKMRLKEMEHERELGKNQLRLAQLGLEKEKQSTVLELKKLEYENAEAEHKRKIELAVAVKKEEREETEKQHQYQLELAERLTTLKEDLCEFYKKYLNALNTFFEKADPFLQERQEFRKKVIEVFLEGLEADDISITQEEYDINDNDLKRIERVVSAKFPILKTDIPLSPELKKLINLVVD